MGATLYDIYYHNYGIKSSHIAQSIADGSLPEQSCIIACCLIQDFSVHKKKECPLSQRPLPADIDVVVIAIILSLTDIGGDDSRVISC